MKSSVLKMGRLLKPNAAFIDEGKRIFKYYNSEPLKNFIEAHYDIHILRAAPLGWGHGNMFFYVRTKDGEYTARVARIRKNLKERIEFEILVTKFLDKNNIPVKTTIKTKNGSDFIEFEDGPIFQLQTFLGGMIPHPIRRFHIKKAGRFLRKIHEVSKDFHKEVPSEIVKKRTLDLIPNIKEIEDSLKLINLRWKFKYHKINIGLFKEEAENFLGDFNKFLKHESLRNRKDFIHGDYNAGNIVFINDKISGIFDFEHASFGPSTYDYGYALAHYSFGFYPEDSKKIMQAFIKGYGKAEDKELLEPLTRLSLLRRATDVVKFKKNYAQREYWEGELKNYTKRFLQFKLWY